MNAKNRQQVLVTHLDDTLFRRVADTLRQSDTDVHRSSWGDTTLELVQSIPFDAILCAYPIDTGELFQFIEIARAEGSACRRAGLVLIAEPDDEREARELIGRGANRVVTTAQIEDKLTDTVDDLASSAPRLSVRAPAQIRLFADGRPLRVMAQAENISTSGMLLKGVTQFPVGTAFDFELTVPGEAAPITGTAEITRATDPRNERIEGIGVRFVSFGGSDKVRLETYLGRELPA
jgi:DNA-binding NarL/FixJ family response regulator